MDSVYCFYRTVRLFLFFGLAAGLTTFNVASAASYKRFAWKIRTDDFRKSSVLIGQVEFDDGIVVQAETTFANGALKIRFRAFSGNDPAPFALKNGSTTVYARLDGGDLQTMHSTEEYDNAFTMTNDYTIFSSSKELLLEFPLANGSNNVADLNIGDNTFSSRLARAIDAHTVTEANSSEYAEAPTPEWCRNASTQTELLICKTPKLKFLDHKMEQMYYQVYMFTKHRNAVAKSQSDWLISRQSCLNDNNEAAAIRCLSEKYSAQKDYWHNYDE